VALLAVQQWVHAGVHQEIGPTHAARHGQAPLCERDLDTMPHNICPRRIDARRVAAFDVDAEGALWNLLSLFLCEADETNKAPTMVEQGVPQGSHQQGTDGSATCSLTSPPRTASHTGASPDSGEVDLAGAGATPPSMVSIRKTNGFFFFPVAVPSGLVQPPTDRHHMVSQRFARCLQPFLFPAAAMARLCVVSCSRP
jgi:hypothetical protein